MRPRETESRPTWRDSPSTKRKELSSWEPWPAFLGLGFFLRGEGIHPTPFGQLASPETFGGFGAGSTAFWIDPDSDVTYAFLSTGLIEETRLAAKGGGERRYLYRGERH